MTIAIYVHFFKNINGKRTFTDMKDQTSPLWNSWPLNKLDFKSF